MNPGSPEALKAGCTCPVVDNANGKGVLGNGEAYGWWVTASCSLHGANTTGEDNPERIKRPVSGDEK